MANDLTGAVWYIDTVMATTYKSQVYLKSLNWSNMAGGDTLVVKDQNGKILYDFISTVANQNINMPSLGWVNGLQVTTLGGGNVQIAVGK